jgi:hypothetical protein
MIYPMGSFAEFFSKDRMDRRNQAEEASGLPAGKFKEKFQECSSWHEDIFVKGPPIKTVEEVFENTSFYHCEIFIALPGKHEELFKQRQMENAYRSYLGRTQNLVFTRVFGAAWDLFTLGCYGDMMQWASSTEIPSEKLQAAAVHAGFEGSDKIGPYMRTLILMHRDTIGVSIK